MKKVAVLGVGRVGRAIALDLAHEGEFEVTAADHSKAMLKPLQGLTGITTVQTDLSDPDAVRSVVESQDIVVGAVPGTLGFQTLRAVIEAGKPVVDISFCPEDEFELHNLACEKGVVAMIDCGVAPGLSNMMLGFHAANMSKLNRFACYVGGLPVIRAWPFEYQAASSPADIIEKYARPARMRIDGKDIVKPALSDIVLMDLPGVGTVEAFNSDGLRTLLTTIDCPNMVEKTVRYPGHALKMRLLRDTGFFETHPRAVSGTEIVPRDLSAELLSAAWDLGDDDEDLTVMRVEVDGEENGHPITHVYDLFDRYNRETRTHSMARTSGYTCTAVVRLLAAGLYDKPGISPPEMLGREPDCLEFILDRLEERYVELSLDSRVPKGKTE